MMSKSISPQINSSMFRAAEHSYSVSTMLHRSDGGILGIVEAEPGGSELSIAEPASFKASLTS